MNKYLELLKTISKLLNQLVVETQTALHRATQVKNDYDSLLLQVAQKQQELDKLEESLKTRAISFENGLQKINDETNARYHEANDLKRQAVHELAEAVKEKELAVLIRKQIEKDRRDAQGVMALAGRK